jgi:AcrR family transcriptional regulator
LAGEKPKTRNARDSRKRLIESAVRVFADRGPHGASVDDICRKAGLTKRMAYHYFGSKEAMYGEALRHVYDQFLSLEISLASMLLPVEKLLDTLVRRYYQFLDAHPAFVRLICYENLNEGRTASSLDLRDKKAPVITALQLALEKGQAEGRFRRDVDVTELLASIFALCFFYFSNPYTMRQFLGRRAGTRPHMEQRINHVVGLLLHGIADGGGKGRAK